MRRFTALAGRPLAGAALLALVLLAGCSLAPSSRWSRLWPVKTGKLPSPAIEEASGIAPSRKTPGLFWINNDSGDRPVLYAINEAGALQGRVLLAGATAVDWEDISSFVMDGRSYLLVADVGDNRAVRDRLALYVIPEPDLSELNPKEERSVSPAWTIPFVFEDGPRDCEAVAVDTAAQEILLVSKRTTPPVVYSLPLRPASEGGPLVAKRLAALGGLPSPNLFDRSLPLPTWRYRGEPTAMDISSDGTKAALLTYGEVRLYERSGARSWSETLSASKGIPLAAHELFQAEGVCFDDSGDFLYVVGEGPRQPIVRYDLGSAR